MDAQAPDSGLSDLADTCRRIRAVSVVLSRLVASLERDGPAQGEEPGRPNSPSIDADLWNAVGCLLDDTAAQAAAMSDRLSSLTESGPAPEPEQKTAPVAATEPPTTIAGMAADLARAALDVDLEQVIEEHEDAWTALVGAVRQRKTPAEAHAAGGEDPMDVYMKLVASMPSELRRDFRRFAESHAIDSLIERDAAFELGRHIERQATVVKTKRATP